MRLCNEFIKELTLLVQTNILSQIQLDIIVSRFNSSTYEEIIIYYGLSGPNPMTHCLVRTSLCLPWAPGMSGGNDPYLSPPDENRFQQACESIKCITTSTAISLASTLKKRD